MIYPSVILVNPQLGENIGMAARAMLNCGLYDLRLVQPRQAWPNEKAVAASAGATQVIDAARLYPTTAAAVGDVQRLYATTARARDINKPAFTAHQAAQQIARDAALGVRSGFMFGPERSGLVNDDISLADAIVTVPLNPDYTSLNLAQAVLLLGYEWRQAAYEESTLPTAPPIRTEELPANKENLITFFERLEDILDEMGFFLPLDKRAIMVRNLRTIFQRADLSVQELNTLHGVVSALLGAKEHRIKQVRERGKP